jgi:predicted RNase H-like HicB family nuclease
MPPNGQKKASMRMKQAVFLKTVKERNMNYTARIYKDGDAYSVEFPDLDGCFTQGNTLEEALANAKEAMELTLEDVFDGCPLPECKTKANEEKGFYRIDVDPELAARFLKSTTP